jgi:hypothetical protein
MNTENLLINAEQILAMALHGLLALVGGIARELGRISQGFSWPRFISGAFISIFAGIVVYFLCQVYSDSQ